MEYSNYTTPSCITLIRALGLLRQPRYIYRGSHRRFVYSRSWHAVPSLWSAVRPVASRQRHQSADALGICSPGHIAAAVVLHKQLDNRRRVDFSLLRQIQKRSTPSYIKIELFNTQSLINKSCLIHNHIQDLICLTETECFFCFKQDLPSWLQLPSKSLHHRDWQVGCNIPQSPGFVPLFSPRTVHFLMSGI